MEATEYLRAALTSLRGPAAGARGFGAGAGAAACCAEAGSAAALLS